MMNEESSIHVFENSRLTPVARHADVVVCGGGPAGVAAALSAARGGLEVVLIENHGCFGGVWTSGYLSWILDAGNKGGVMSDIRLELDRRNAYSPGRGKSDGFAYDVEAMKELLDEWVIKAGIRPRLHTRVVGAQVEENRLKGVFTESASGRECWTGKVFIDATGNGDLGAFAGNGFDYGSPEDGVGQPMSMVALLTGLDVDSIHEFIGGGMRRPKELLAKAMENAGCVPSYSQPMLLRIHDDLFVLIANHEYGATPMDADSITTATMRSRSEIGTIVRALRNSGDPWSGLRLISTAPQIGIREGRRLHGMYEVTGDDMREGRRHHDAICRVTFGVDVHSRSPRHGRDVEASAIGVSLPYDIPYRALVAKDVDGLLMAGRCISGDFISHSSYRVTGNAVTMGEAAGKAAIDCAINGIFPSELTRGGALNAYC